MEISLAKEFTFTYEVSETDADTIETFLDARANDSDSFNFAEGFVHSVCGRVSKNKKRARILKSRECTSLLTIFDAANLNVHVHLLF